MITTLTDQQKYFPVFCAGGVVTSIPIMILFFWLQKYYVEGITGGAVKG
jgi:arabinogalactan oligomer/maltooligosaccharide transport system permease protein